MFLACQCAQKTIVTHTTKGEQKHKVAHCSYAALHDGMHRLYGLLSSNNTTIITHMVSDIAMHMYFGVSRLSPAAFQEELLGQCIQGAVRAVVDDMVPT
jgi:hypothetical protein